MFRRGRGFIEFSGQCDATFFIFDDADEFFSDIPLPLVTSGCENSGNLRELALNRMKDFGAVCRDVRFREVGVRGSFFL